MESSYDLPCPDQDGYTDPSAWTAEQVEIDAEYREWCEHENELACGQWFEDEVPAEGGAS